MEYLEFKNAVKRLGYLQSEEQVDAAVKAVLGHVASRLDEDDARVMCQQLPDPLTLEKLRGRQPDVSATPAEEFIENIREHFNLSEGQALEITSSVLEKAREAVGEQGWERVQQSLPEDWKVLIMSDVSAP